MFHISRIEFYIMLTALIKFSMQKGLKDQTWFLMESIWELDFVPTAVGIRLKFRLYVVKFYLQNEPFD